MVLTLRFLVFCLLLAGISLPLSAAASSVPAAFTLSGHINNNQGSPLPGAVITVRGTTVLATTNAAGTFLLSTEQATPVLLVTCQGYQPQTLAVQALNALAITLYPIGVAPPLEKTVPEGNLIPVANSNLIVADVQPTFPGGAAAYREYIRQNARYPDKAKEAGKAGSVFVGFVVDEAGRVLDAQVLKGLGYGLDEEAVRLIRLMPWWTPALLNGKPVRVPCTLRIRFGVQEQP